MYQCCDKFGGDIRIVDSVLSFSSVDELKARYREQMKWIDVENIGNRDYILFPDEAFSTDSTVSVYGHDVMIGTPNRYVWVRCPDWEERLDLAEACQSVYVEHQEWLPEEILREAEERLEHRSD